MEPELFAPIACTAQNTNPIFQSRFRLFPEYGEAHDRFTIADITALVAIDIGGRLADIQIAARFAHLTRWHEMVSKRASAKVRGVRSPDLKGDEP